MALVKEHNSYNLEILNLAEIQPNIYNKLNEACESIAEDIAIAEALRDAHFDGSDDFGDRLYDYCERNCDNEESLSDFNS